MSGVDVLAFFDDCIHYLGAQDNLAGYEVEQAGAARAAVAELIEVASLFDSYSAADMGDTSILDQEELWDRLAAALRRVKGE